MFAVDYLPDMDEDHLAAVGRVTRRLLGALGADEALEDEIRHQAEVLCRLVAPSAGESRGPRRKHGRWPAWRWGRRKRGGWWRCRSPTSRPAGRWGQPI